MSKAGDCSLPFCSRLHPVSFEKAPSPLSACVDQESPSILLLFAGAHSPLSPWEERTPAPCDTALAV